MKKPKYYCGDGRKFFQISRLLEKSNLTENEQKIIFSEIEFLSLTCQDFAAKLSELNDFHSKIKESLKQYEI